MITLLAAILRLVSDALNGQKTDEEVAKELITAAFESGVPASVLMGHLTQLGRERTDLAVDIAQFIKTGGK